jgi:hypothetical protein
VIVEGLHPNLRPHGENLIAALGHALRHVDPYEARSGAAGGGGSQLVETEKDLPQIVVHENY